MEITNSPMRQAQCLKEKVENFVVNPMSLNEGWVSMVNLRYQVIPSGLFWSPHSSSLLQERISLKLKWESLCFTFLLIQVTCLSLQFKVTPQLHEDSFCQTFINMEDGLHYLEFFSENLLIHHFHPLDHLTLSWLRVFHLQNTCLHRCILIRRCSMPRNLQTLFEQQFYQELIALIEHSSKVCLCKQLLLKLQLLLWHRLDLSCLC